MKFILFNKIFYLNCCAMFFIHSVNLFGSMKISLRVLKKIQKINPLMPKCFLINSMLLNFIDLKINKMKYNIKVNPPFHRQKIKFS